MKKTKKYLLMSLILLIIVCGVVIFINNKNSFHSRKVVDIEEVLLSPSYSYLPERAKDYIREYYKETGEVLLTEKNKETDKKYLNPQYVEYLEGKEDNSGVAPSSTVVDYNPKMVKSPTRGVIPSSYDLRNVNGKNFVTPFEAQGAEGLCWDYATNAHAESFMLLKSNQSYNANSTVLSKHQMDYATAGVTTYGKGANNSFLCGREGALSGAGDFACSAEVMIDGLGFVSNEWDAEHSREIQFNENHPKEPIDAVDIYDLNNSLYEVNSTIDFPFLDFDTATEEEKNSYLTEVKTRVMEYGGAYLAVSDESASTMNAFHGQDIKTIHAYGGSWAHALEIIGWDDDFEYTICTNIGGSPYPSDCPAAKDRFTGKGVWITKNSDEWNPITLVGYESPENSINFITDFGTKNWDNYYQLTENYLSYNNKTYTFNDTTYINNEKLKKIKIYLGQNTNYKIYMDISGNSNFTLLNNLTTTYAGYYMFDLSSSNYNINENTTFKIVTDDKSQIDFRVYTSNTSNDIKIKTFDTIYDSSNATLNNTKYFDLNIYSSTKNLDNNKKLTFKIKDSNGTYVNPDGYEYSYNGIYANMSNVKLTINSDYFSKGNYKIETYYNNTLYSTSDLKIKFDLAVIEGDGSSGNPWQISTPTQFDLIRNNPYDSFILKNDIDFEYDTQNENGLFYNDGFGFSAIEDFYGYLDGNGHSIKNIYSKSDVDENNGVERRIGGIFGHVYIDENSKLNKVGIANLKVINPSITGAIVTGGLVNNLIIRTTDKAKLENLSVIGGQITNVGFPSHSIGGLIGFFGTDEYDVSGKITFTNLFNSSNVISSNNNEFFDEMVGGIVGSLSPRSLYIQNSNNVEFNNVMNVGKIVKTSLTASSSNLFNLGYADNSNITVNNAISINNASIRDIDSHSSSSLGNCKVTLNNVYTSATNAIGSSITNTKNNVKSNLSIYEIANENYSNWSNFSNNWYQNKGDGVNRIPVIKNVSYDYLSIDTEVVLRAGDSIDVLDLISSKNKDISLMTTCNYNLDICNNTTDTNVISITGTVITALNNGSTSVIVAGKNDGYLGVINVYVGDYVKVTYHSNDGKDSSYKQGVEKNTDTQLEANKFTRTGYKFIKWNTKADGSGTNYDDNQTVNISSDLQLYAKWETIKYQITFDSNGGSGNMSSINADYTEEYTLEANKFTREHYFFMGWNTKADGSGTNYADKAKVKNLTATDGGTVTLYAVWKAADGVIKFHANNDSEDIIEQDFIFDVDFNLTENSFSYEGYKFIKWNTEADGSGTSYNNKQVMHINHEASYKTIDLYAVWDEEYDFIINNYSSDREDKIIDLIEYDTDLDKFKSNIVLNPKYSIDVEYKEVDGNRCVYTGGKTKILKNNANYMEFINIVRGDVNGNGTVDIIDYIKIRKEILDKEKLNGIYKTAADISKNNTIDDADYTKIKDIIMGDVS